MVRVAIGRCVWPGGRGPSSRVRGVRRGQECVVVPSTTTTTTTTTTMPNMNLKKLWRKKTVTLTEYDPTYKVIYLGNVLTGWAKGTYT